MDSSKYNILRVFALVCFGVIVLRLFFIQIVERKYKSSADSNVLRYEVQYPPRGEIFDRNGEFLAQSREAYDLMAVPRDVLPFDTMLMCSIIGATPESVKAALDKARAFSPRQSSAILKLLPKETKLKLEELSFPGFYLQYRTVRHYPRKIAGNLLGDVGEVNEKILERDLYYRPGDYIGMSGVERSYEEVLRGRKGVRISMVDVHGVHRGSYMNGLYDTLPELGRSITCTVDARLQQLGEELMAGKVGSIVAIEPSTGEILAMVSSPTYNPDDLVGAERGNNYAKLLNNKQLPLFNRAVMSPYPPGSTFKLINGLIGLQEGVLTPGNHYPCYRGYPVGRGVKCHGHASPLPLIDAVQTSCNSYFCYVFRNIVDNKKYGNLNSGLDRWNEYVRSFGFGRRLESDFKDERKGNVPTSQYYDRKYRDNWNSLTIISLSIGQGEMGCTPMQMANLSATVANRGFYYIPHVVKRIGDGDSLSRRFYEPQYTMVDPKHFAPIVEGMFKAVNRPGGTAGVAQIDGIEVCGKTGTAQTPHGKDNSTFLCFAPRNNPKIALSVYVENGGFGATVAAPIASLLVEQYLTGEIRRTDMLNSIKNMHINYPHYAK
ncbi:MAG: penicillin-binding protein 2 [Rikenellaceae bacterium]|jgi:penicillin-binding protein 2|nr:penicillin-binding protein 2 [Rikenellaceae bacterium]